MVDREHRATPRLPGALLAYAAALAVFLLIPPTLKPAVGPPRSFTLQELADLLTPVVVIPLAWLVLDSAGGVRRRALIGFLVITAIWIEAQGIHLAANALGDAFPKGPARDAFYATDAGELDHWLDEVLSHWLWHVAWAALWLLMLWTASRRPVWPTRSGRSTATVAGVIHGVTFFFVTAEGATTLVAIPVCILVLAWAGLEAVRGSTNPIIRFSLVAAATTLLADLGWAAIHGWQLIEPCEVLAC